MVNDELLKYIKEETNRGVSKEIIADVLLKAGWSLDDIENGFKSATSPMPPKADFIQPDWAKSSDLKIENKNPISTQTDKPTGKNRHLPSLKSAAIDIVAILIIVTLVYVFANQINGYIQSLMKKPATSGQTTNTPSTTNTGSNVETNSTSPSVNDNDHSKADFVVTNISVNPNPPKIYSTTTQIVVTIKNQGTTSSEPKGFANTAEIVGFKLPQINGQIQSSIKAGETIVWIFRPFSPSVIASSTSLDIKNSIGTSTIKINLNQNQSLVETDYSNDVFTKDYNFVQ